MNNYIFKTTTTMKEYNNKKWWIDSNIIGEIRVTAENIIDSYFLSIGAFCTGICRDSCYGVFPFIACNLLYISFHDSHLSI